VEERADAPDAGAPAEVASPGPGVASAPSSPPVTDTVSADVVEAVGGGVAERDTGRKQPPQPAAAAGQAASPTVAAVSRQDAADVVASAAVAAGSDGADRVVPVVQGVAVTPVPGDSSPVQVTGESAGMSAAEPAAESTALSEAALLTVLAPLVAPGTGAPVEPPAMWALLAFARRQIGADDASPGDQNLLGTPEEGEPELSGLGALAAAADTTAPTVSFIAPADGEAVSGAVGLIATASDDVGVAGVQFWANGVVVEAEVHGSLYGVLVPTTAAPDGAYLVTAVARDAAGNTTTSAPITIIVDNTAPTVTLTAPADGATVAGVVTVTATASDNVGVAWVEFRTNDNSEGAVDTTSPYGVSESTTAAPDGTYVVTAVARDTAGNITISAPVTFIVDNTAPAVSVTAPADGEAVSGVVTFTAAASDSAGVAEVRFLANGVEFLAEDTGSGYSLSVPTTAVPDGTYVVSAVARDTVGNTTTSAPVTFIVDNTAPAVTLTAPADGAIVSGLVTLSATASDSVGVAGVQFLVNGVAVADELTDSPYSLSVPTTAADDGTYVVSARARDAAGNTTMSAPVTFVVANGTSGPTVAVTSAGGPVSGLVTLTAAASDDDGVAGVQFLVNGGPLGDEDTASSYSVSVLSTAAHDGTYVVTARARDSLGNLTTSAPVTIVVDNTAPTVALTAPADGATVSGLVTLTAAASDGVGVAGVQFLANGVPVGDEFVDAPYSLSVLTTADHDGAYVVTAVVRDAVGNLTTSAPITVIVDNTPPTIDNVNTITGVVIGSLNVPDTPPFSYTVPNQGAGAPGYGTVTVAPDGTFTYTPTQAARLRAGLGEIEEDGFTVTVSDGQYSIAVAVTNVPVVPAQLTVSTPIAVGSLPFGVALSPDGSLAYVTNIDSDTVSVIDAATHTVIDADPATPEVDAIPVGSWPYAVAFSPDGSVAYVTDQVSDTVSVIDTATHTVVDTDPATPGVDPIRFGFTPYVVAFSPDGGLAYVTNSTGVSVIDTATHTIVDADPVTPGVDPIRFNFTPYGVAFSPDGGFAYVTNSNGVSVIDTATHTVIDADPATPAVDAIPVGTPLAVAFSPDGSFAYVTHEGGGTVSVIDTVTHTVIDTDADTPAVDAIPVGSGPGLVAFSRDGSLAYVTNANSDTVSVIDTATHTVVDINPATPGVDGIPVGSYPTGVAVSPDGSFAYVTNSYSNTVSVISLGANTPPVVNGDPTIDSINPASGVVSGSLNVTDTEALSYTVPDQGTGAPAYGTVTIAPDGTFTYTPTQAARLRAGLGEIEQDAFTVTVSDGQHSIAVTVTNVPVAPAELAVSPPIVVGGSPVGVAFSPDGDVAYVTDGGGFVGYSVSVIDTATHTVVDTNPATPAVDPIVVGGWPQRVAFSPDGSFAYVTNQGSGTVSVIDTATHTVIDADPATPVVDSYLVGGAPYGVAFSPDGGFAYVTNANGNTVSVIDTATHTVIDTNPATPAVDRISVGSLPYGVAFSPNGGFAYVTNGGSDTVSVIDTATHTVIDANPATPGVDPIPVAGLPYGVAFSPDGDLAYVVNLSGNTVSVIDTATHTVIDADPATPGVDAISVGGGPREVAFSPDGSLAYVTNFASDTVSVIDTATRTVIDADPATPAVDAIPVGSYPRGVAVSPNGGFAYVTNQGGGAVSVISLGANTAPVVTVPDRERR
jgi:YVTN family beta-propeller protein/VCBS repeat-containing protein